MEGKNRNVERPSPTCRKTIFSRRITLVPFLWLPSLHCPSDYNFVVPGVFGEGREQNPGCIQNPVSIRP